LTIFQALDIFCYLADENDDVPNLEGGKKYSYYKLSNEEWNVIRLCCNALEVCISLVPIVLLRLVSQIVSKLTTELGQETVATCQKVFPILERAQIKWEELVKDTAYEPIRPALQAGLHNMRKWYRSAVDSPIYFICHGMISCLPWFCHAYDSY
jgi:hypothetical protein